MFIVFEGLDGSGSTTQAKLLTNYFLQEKVKALHTSEPTDSHLGKYIRKALQKEWTTSPEALQLLFTADRAHHLFTEIEPALSQGTHVVCDRYIWSTIAYGSLKCDTQWLTSLNKNFRMPDIIFFLDVDVDTCLRRIQKRGSELELFEEEKKLNKIRNTFQKLARDSSNAVSISGIQSPEETLEHVWKVVASKL
jgi:dTMP kinase